LADLQRQALATTALHRPPEDRAPRDGLGGCHRLIAFDNVSMARTINGAWIASLMWRMRGARCRMPLWQVLHNTANLRLDGVEVGDTSERLGGDRRRTASGDV
jgi:hypothetical protein